MYLKALSTIADIDSVEIEDYYRLMALCRQFRSQRTSEFSAMMQSLSAASKQPLKGASVNRTREMRSRLLEKLVECYVAENCIVDACKLLQGRVGDPAYFRSDTLVAQHAVLSCMKIILSAYDVYSKFERDRKHSKILKSLGYRVPSLVQVANNHLLLSYSVQFLCSSQYLQLSKVADSHMRSQLVSLTVFSRDASDNLLREAKQLLSVAASKLSGDFVEFHSLNIGFQEGLRRGRLMRWGESKLNVSHSTLLVCISLEYLCFQYVSFAFS